MSEPTALCRAAAFFVLDGDGAALPLRAAIRGRGLIVRPAILSQCCSYIKRFLLYKRLASTGNRGRGVSCLVWLVARAMGVVRLGDLICYRKLKKYRYLKAIFRFAMLFSMRFVTDHIFERSRLTQWLFCNWSG